MLAASCWNRRAGGARAAALVAAVLVIVVAPAARGQGLLDRSPNLAGGWIGQPGVLQFNFMHRFRVSDAPQRKVTNTPTFTLAAGLPWRTLLGVNYATNSVVAPNFPNEWELFGRVLPVSESTGAPLDVAVQVDYNVAAESVDGELALARSFGPVRLIAAGRAFSNAYHQEDRRFALAGGAAIRLSEHLAVAGDVATLLSDREALSASAPGDDVEERAAWSVGVQLAIPYTPHTLSLHASNANTTTLQGASLGGDGVMYGFEFTIPITLRRYLPSGGPEPVAAEPPPQPEPAARDTAAAEPAGRPREPVAGAVRITSRAPTTPRDSVASKADSLRSVANADSARAAANSAPAKAAADSARPAAAGAAGAGRPARPAGREPAARKPARREVVVEIRSLQFGTGRIEIDAGTTVVWRNADPVAHTATAADGSWDSGSIDPGKSWSRTFDRPGTYAYFCTPHPFMKAVVVVRGGEN